MDSTAKVAEIEQAEKEKMKEKVDRILKHGINCFINRYVFIGSRGELRYFLCSSSLCWNRQLVPSRHLRIKGLRT